MIKTLILIAAIAIVAACTNRTHGNGTTVFPSTNEEETVVTNPEDASAEDLEMEDSEVVDEDDDD